MPYLYTMVYSILILHVGEVHVIKIVAIKYSNTSMFRPYWFVSKLFFFFDLQQSLGQLALWKLFCHQQVIFKLTFSIKLFFKEFFSSINHSIKMSSSFDPDQAESFVRPGLDPNCLQRLTAGKELRHQA